MAIRTLTLAASLLVAGGFVAGRAFSQNELPEGSTIPSDPPQAELIATDPVGITVPHPTSRTTLDPVRTAVTRPVMPMKYFVPTVKDSSSTGVEHLRERFTQVTAERAAIMSQEELQTEIAAIEKVLREFSAKQSLDRALKSLEAVVSDYPETAAGKDAQKAIELLKAKPAVTGTYRGQ